MLMTLKEANDQLKQALSEYYDNREAGNITALVMEHLTGFNRTDRLIHQERSLSTDEVQLLGRYLQELLAHKPVQYVLGTTHFAGLDLQVDEHVLIPRPETEELVEWIVHSVLTGIHEKFSLLDIGTGSGCIALALKHRLPQLKVTATDVDKNALAVAARNAAQLHLPIEFFQSDILLVNNWPFRQNLDLIVSNPPYIGAEEKSDMLNHVLDYEPHTALFVTGEDVLIFYRRIAEFALLNLKPGGSLFFEINEQYSRQIYKILTKTGFEAIEIRKDLQGKDRMVKCLLKK